MTEAYSRLLQVLIDCGIRNASEPARQRLARECADRSVQPDDIRLAIERAVTLDGKSRVDAARIVAAQLASPETWEAYVDGSRRALLDAKAVEKRGVRDHDHGRSMRMSASELRAREYRALGLSDSDARLVEIGGYVHGRIVGDELGLRPDHRDHADGDKLQRMDDLAQEVGLDPWMALQAACWWSDMLHDRRATLLRTLQRLVLQGRCSESLLEHAYSVPVRQGTHEKPVTIKAAWRARAKSRVPMPTDDGLPKRLGIDVRWKAPGPSGGSS